MIGDGLTRTARDRDRTCTRLLEPAPQAGASANSATRAIGGDLIRVGSRQSAVNLATAGRQQVRFACGDLSVLSTSDCGAGHGFCDRSETPASSLWGRQ